MNKVLDTVALIAAHLLLALCVSAVFSAVLYLLFNFGSIVLLCIIVPMGACAAFETIAWAFNRVCDYWEAL